MRGARSCSDTHRQLSSPSMLRSRISRWMKKENDRHLPYISFPPVWRHSKDNQDSNTIAARTAVKEKEGYVANAEPHKNFHDRLLERLQTPCSDLSFIRCTATLHRGEITIDATTKGRGNPAIAQAPKLGSRC